MSASEILKSAACQGNWPAEEKIAAMLDYIENQQDNECFQAFLDERLRLQDEASTRAYEKLLRGKTKDTDVSPPS